MALGFLPTRPGNRNFTEPRNNWFASNPVPERDRAALLRLGKKPVLKVWLNCTSDP